MQNSNRLLPSGFVDILPPYAWRERRLRNAMVESFGQFGYQEVSPPLVEFENSVVDKPELEQQTFRILDAKSQRMMGVRADMTPQISRIAASRMQDAPLPLRLSYAGTCLRVKGEGLYKSRQLIQAGVECIGVSNDDYLIEVIRCTIEALENVGIKDVSLDITLPNLANELLKPIPIEQHSEIKFAIEQKNRDAIGKLSHPIAEVLLKLMDGADLKSIEGLINQLPTIVGVWVDKVNKISEMLPSLKFTLDPLEQSGFDYYDGIAFSLFSASLGAEIGYGGRYIAHDNLLAYGISLYLNPLLRNSSLKDNSTRCLVLAGANEQVAKKLREKGWHTLYTSAKTPPESIEEAKKFGCTHILEEDSVNDV